MATIKLELASLTGLAEKVAQLTSEEFAALSVDAVNKAIHKAYDITVPRINRAVNLPDSYVRQRMTLREASTNNPVASIVAAGSKPMLTQLVRYSPTQLFKSTKDKKRLKKGGVSVEVLRGSVKAMPGAFLIELKNGVGQGIAVRTGTGRGAYKVLYGPSVYQLFKNAVSDTLEQVEGTLSDSLVGEVNAHMEKIFGETT